MARLLEQVQQAPRPRVNVYEQFMRLNLKEFGGTTDSFLAEGWIRSLELHFKTDGEFWLDIVAFLGHIVSRDGIEVDPNKVEEVRNWPAAKSVTEICSFLGIVGYYRKFIQDFFSIAMPMTALTKNNTKFNWGSECQESFDRLKLALTTAPVLAMPSGQREFVVIQMHRSSVWARF
ncbi:putative mitochondrial protein AtMg00860 [Primulina tabacum]|uniref:putative mitochondrial protein AtMg00860 n=1 Tax=Primulina tabacum TaxID=48773 RepID=UPI003F5980EC